MNWKALAIVLLLILLLENGLLIWAYKQVTKEEEKTYECYYEICADYPQAYFDSTTNLCTCYDYDLLGDLQEVNTKWMK